LGIVTAGVVAINIKNGFDTSKVEAQQAGIEKNVKLTMATKTFTMSMDEVLQDMECQRNETTHTYYSGFKTLDDGDILIIEDKIWNMTYNSQYDATMVLFSSNNSQGLSFAGDITNKFHDGENVKVKLHIIEDKFDYIYQGQTWKMDVEYYKEGWDMTNHTPKHLPASVITCANASIVYVYVDDDYNSNTSGWNYNRFNKIQDAINAANDGSTIFVYNGTYHENIIINKSVTLIGEDRNTTIIDGDNISDVIAIFTNGTTVRNLTLRNAAGIETIAGGIRVFSSHNIISGCIVKNCTAGIVLSTGSYDNTIINNSLIHGGVTLGGNGWDLYTYFNKIENNIVNGKPLYYFLNRSDIIIGEDDVGQLIFVNCTNCSVSNINISYTIVGAYVAFGNDIEFINCNISHNYLGISLQESHHLLFSNIECRHNYAGVGFSQTDNSTISELACSNNELYGINIDANSNNNNIMTSIFLNNSWGIIIDDYSDNNTISSSIFRDNSFCGIVIVDDSHDNIIYHNNFIENSNQSYDECNNTWDNGYEGNYWSDFDEPSEGAYDNDSDGIVDNPYYIQGGGNVDRYPLMKPWDQGCEYISHNPIYINGNENFTSENGVISGNGTENNPYVIEGWEIDASTANGIKIINTTAFFIIRNCSISHGRNNYHDGIVLSNVINGKIIDNKIFDNFDGVTVTVYGISGHSSQNQISDNIIFDNVRGVDLSIFTNNNTISRNLFKNNTNSAIEISSSSGNLIVGNTILNHNRGIYIVGFPYPEDNIISNNSLENCLKGIYLEECLFTMIENNKLNNASLDIWGHELIHYIHHINNNTVNGKPFYYYKNLSNFTLSIDTGCAIIVNCTIVNVHGVNIQNVLTGIHIAYSAYIDINNCTISNIWQNGVVIEYSNNISIYNCNISNNWGGIYVKDSHNLALHYNHICNNFICGIVNEYWDGGDVVNASYNYWGSSSGPSHPILNPNGTGDNVSDNVTFVPWLTVPVKGGIEEKLQQGENEINAIDEADTLVKMNTTANNSIRIISYQQAPIEEPDAVKSVGKYVEISIKNETAIKWPIFIQIYYTQQDLDKTGINESELLGIYFYNETSKKWQLYNDTGVNTTDVVINGKQYAGHAYAYAWHLTNLTICAKPPWDLNWDNTINILDLIIVAMHFGSHEGEAGYDESVDLNNDKEINILDLIIVAMHFGEQY